MAFVRSTSLAALAALLVACSPSAQDGQPGDASVPGDTASTAPYAGIAPDEILRFSGTEPFWGGRVGGGTLTYTTPDNPDGETVPVERFAGRGGLSFSGALGGEAFEMTVTPLSCSDGMSDRKYPFTVTLKRGEDLRNGCGWSDRHPFEGPEAP